MDGKRVEKVVDWLQDMQPNDSLHNLDISDDAILASSPLCQALSLALGDNGGASDSARQQQQYNLACHELKRGGLAPHLTDGPEQAGVLVRYLLTLAGRMDPGGQHAELARLLLTCQPPCRQLDDAGVERYWRMCLSLASRQPDLCRLAINSAIGWFYPVEADADAGAAATSDDFEADRRQFRLAHRLLEALADAFPAAAPDAICELAESRCLWGRPTRQLACYLLNMLRAAATYLAGRQIRLLVTACRTVAKLESALASDEAAGCAAGGCTCQPQHREQLQQLAARVSAQRPGADDLWELSPQLHGLLTAWGRALCRACDRREKLNVCLHVLLRYARSELAAGEWRRTKTLYKDLLTVFDQELAHHTGPSRLNLLLALLCAADDRIAHGFFDYLWKRATDSRVGTGLRLRFLALLGDLCARCQFVHLHLLQTVLLMLADYARRLAARYDKKAGTLCADESSLFHACARTFVRIAVCRHRDLLSGAEGCDNGATLAGTHFHLVLRSSLRPWPALPGDLRARFALMSRRYRLPEFESAVADLSAELNAGGCGGGDDGVQSSIRKRKLKRRRTTLNADAATAAGVTSATAEEALLPARLDDLSLSRQLLQSLLLPEEPLPEEPPPLPLPSSPQQLHQPPERALHSTASAAAALEPPQMSLAEALMDTRQLLKGRRKRLRSDCVVFGE